MIFVQKKLVCCSVLLLLFSCFNGYAQINITGRVLDADDDTPLPASTVYFNYTTIVTHTDEHGDFFFNNINMLNSELVISCSGYEILVYRVAMEQVKGKRIVFKLAAKKQSNKDAIIVAEAVKERWRDIISVALLKALVL